jgi:membrane protease YdiL (CAAX protease family)
MALVALGLAIGPGSARLALAGGSLAVYMRAAVPVLALLFMAALAEELMFRGYPLQRLSVAFGPVQASVTLAVLFAAMHLWNPETSRLGIANVALASLVLSAAFFTPGRLPAAWGLHFGWNAGLGLADAPVSGIRFELPGVDFIPGEPEWFSGGGFGPEGGFVASVVMAVTLAVLVLSNSRLMEDRSI